VSSEQRLREIRARIDALDAQIQQLIAQRARCAQEIAQAKTAAGEGNGNFYRPDREAEVLRRVVERDSRPLPPEEMARIFREIMSACLALESPLRVAFLGPEGTYTHAAALKHFGQSVQTAPLGAIDEVFREVEARDAHFGVVPIENSTEGVVTHTLDMFVRSPLRICGEVELRVHHCLLAKSGALGDVRRVLAHQQSLAQCREWLNAHLPRVDIVAVSSNAEAARQVANDAGAAAIAGETAAALYRLNILARNIEDEPNNTTRFLIVGPLDPGVTGADKTSLLLSAPNRPGMLHDLLNALAKRNISLTRIESRPSRQGLWEYVFFIDIDGHAHEPRIAEALDELRAQAAFVKLLGSYPKAVL